jgi:uncharacterized membrane protein YjjB (DUF3815 family)
VIDLAHLLHQIAFGALAAAGFGVLFNFGFRALVWCALCGALALGVRTLGLDAGWSLEAASFIAAAGVAATVIGLLEPRIGAAGNAMALAGCIPMVPGAFFTQAILGLFALTAPAPENIETTIILTLQCLLRVIFTVGAIGAGLAIPAHLLKSRDF